jgi:hypothetical protein
METSNIGNAARHCTGTLHDHVVGGGIRMRLESASINQSCVAPLKHSSELPDYQSSRALSRLVVEGGRQCEMRPFESVCHSADCFFRALG